MDMLSRRQLLLGAGAATGMSLAPRLGLASANAAQTGGYRALVCLFLYGGMDCHDTLMPLDTTSYDQFRDARKTLMSSYAKNPVGQRRKQADLLELDARRSANLGNRHFALPPEMAELQALFNQGNASIVANVGPLIEKTNRANVLARTAALPKSLFSHNDQQTTWMSLSPEGARFGWGGKFADEMIASNANSEPSFSTISVAGNNVFLSGVEARPFQISSNGAVSISQLDSPRILGPGKTSSRAVTLLKNHLLGAGPDHRNKFEQDMEDLSIRSVETNSRFNDALGNPFPLTTKFPNTPIGQQLKTIAETIGVRDATGARRQVFYAGMGSYDTHSRQSTHLPQMQRDLSQAIGAFYAATAEMGMHNDVALFTASDFGRTLTANGDGTDHGWGSHHFVVGGGVNGGRIFGDIPPPTFEHKWDAGRGRLIPTYSVEQFASPLAKWFGVSNAERRSIFPMLTRFNGHPNVI